MLISVIYHLHLLIYYFYSQALVRTIMRSMRKDQQSLGSRHLVLDQLIVHVMT